METIDRESPRPFGIIAIAVIQFFGAVTAFIEFYGTDPLNIDFTTSAEYVDLARLVLGILGFCVAIGLLLGMRWSWLLIMLVLLIDMSLGIWSYFQDSPNYVSLALNAASIFYLNSRDVRRAFGYGRTRESLIVERS